MKFLLFTLLVIWQQPLMCLGHPYFTEEYGEDNMTYMSEARLLAKRGCNDSCGDVLIPYPFGMRSVGGGSNCYYNESYEIICNTSGPFLKILDLEVMGIALFYEINPIQAVVAVRMRLANVCSRGYASSRDLQGTPYRYSVDGNAFIAQGCSGIIVRNRTGGILNSCTPTCMSNNNNTLDYSSFSCDNGIGCCRAYDSESKADFDYFNISVSQDNDTVVGSAHGHGCNTTVAFIDSRHAYSDPDAVNGNGTILRWMVPEALLNYGDHANVSCYQDQDDEAFPSCECNQPYLGNPYLPYGCQVDCSFYGEFHHCQRLRLLRLAIILGVSIGTGVVLLLLCGYWLYKFARRTTEIKRRSKNFKRNGGLLLQQQLISTTKGIVDKTKIFTLLELEKITDNFNENRILGQGGQGTVYKGMMEDDGKIVAIKKSKKVDEDQLEQFINEVVIVSQINHRNVVKLLGCCLETEVPLLVYEFIPNGTLYHHIHNTSEDFNLIWKMRLQIATESAWALAHLHSSTSPPIYHRDIKSSNILLDDKYRAKVSDFGTSKAITIDQTHVTTCVQGTYGYLDPEYFQSTQFTDKSDVYSFGVVLVELITGMKPITPTKSGGWISLASEFLFHMESCILDDILDTRVLEECKKEELVAVAKIARQCLKRNGKRRPTMKQVAKLLDEIRSPYQENLKQLNDTEISPILEINEMHNRSFSNVEMASCSYIEVQPLIVNTF